MLRKLFMVMVCIGLLAGTAMETDGFEVIWELSVSGWAHMPIIKDGVVYNVWCAGDGSLTATDLYTGQLLKRKTSAGSATAPFIVGNNIYSYRSSALHEINLEEHLFTLMAEPEQLMSYPFLAHAALPYDEHRSIRLRQSCGMGSDTTSNKVAHHVVGKHVIFVAYHRLKRSPAELCFKDVSL